MTFSLLTPKELPLPPALSYQITRTDGSSADSFEAVFPADAAFYAPLAKHSGFLCRTSAGVLLRGMVDEVELEYGNRHTVTLCGRGMAAPLMDSQMGYGEYYNLELSGLLSQMGITGARVEGGPYRLQSVCIRAGCSLWTALNGFCLHAHAPQPRFLRDGTLYIGLTHGTHRLSEDTLLHGVKRLCRYGGIWEQRVHDLTTGTVSIAQSAIARDFGITTTRYATRSGAFLPLTERTPAQRLQEANKNLYCLELTLPGYRDMEPGDRVLAELPSLDAAGVFRLAELCHRCDAAGSTTTLILQKTEEA